MSLWFYTSLYRWRLTSDRLHVKISDTAEQQFTIPESIVARPSAPVESYTDTSDLLFNYDSSPFAFWITRRSEPDAMPLFDTRISSLPPTPIGPLNASDPSTTFDAFPLVFEDQYLQVGLEYATEYNQSCFLGGIRTSLWYQYIRTRRGDCKQRIQT